MFVRIFGYRIAQVRQFSFKRPPPGYMYKRPVVPSDLQTPPKKHVFDIENEKWCEDKDNDKKDIFKTERQYTRTNPYNGRQD